MMAYHHISNLIFFQPMNKIIKNYILAILLTAGGIGMNAQEASRSGYFLEGYNFRHQLNPAFAPEQNYFSIPALGNLGIGAMSNVGVNTFLYKLPNGDLTTFMNSTVGADEFIGKLKNNNKITADINLTLLSGGFRGFKGYNTVTLSVRSDIGANLPKDLLRFMKLGQDGPDTRYDFSNLRVKANAYAEIALGHQHKINNELNVGGKIKFLLGVGNVDANIKNMSIGMGYDKWEVEAQGELNIAAGSGLRVPTNYESGKNLDKPSEYDQIDYDGINYDNFGLSGFGMAFDLGATYDMHHFVEGLTLSAALLDLGFINWKHNVYAATPATQWSFDGFHDIALDEDQPDFDDNKLDQQLDDMWDGLKDCANFERKSQNGSRTSALAATLSLGAEYRMPFYNKLTGGFLFTQRFAGCFSWSEGRFSANYKPTRWFDMSVNYGASSFGSSFGWMLNFHPSGYTFFIGSDHQIFKITKGIPLPVGKTSMNLNIGMSITFGKKA